MITFLMIFWINSLIGTLYFITFKKRIMEAIYKDEFFDYEVLTMPYKEVERMVFRNYAFFGILTVFRLIFIAH